MVDATSRLNTKPDQPLVSIVTVVYNGAKHLEQAIESVAGQTYPNIEYILIDGGSTDGTLDIIRRHERSLSYWASRPDKGMYFAMNEGIDRSTGELVGLLHSDDWFEPDAIGSIVGEYLASDRQSILYGIVRYYDEDGLDMLLSYDHRKLPSRMINHPACFVPKKIYSRMGMFDTRYRIAADYDFLLRAYRQGVPFKHVEKVIASFRHGGYSSRNRSAQEVLRIQLENGYKTRAQYLIASALGMAKRAAGTITAHLPR